MKDVNYKIYYNTLFQRNIAHDRNEIESENNFVGLEVLDIKSLTE